MHMRDHQHEPGQVCNLVIMQPGAEPDIRESQRITVDHIFSYGAEDTGSHDQREQQQG